ncbi:TetR/AcrR family transcriptional regulator [Pseudonocardia sp. GCM10023141]|uniref:TetR/AcrR family transcriptional regulator n=1 Tax=Pseudonocardia sp. GCM10023141 TaxID=3252653 RepID=UPI00361D0DC7
MKQDAPTEAAPPPLTSRGESTRERILQSAAGVLAEHGYAGSTLNDIAERAGTKAGSLYYYFASREDLIREIMTRGITETLAHVIAAVDALEPSASSQDRLAAAVTAHVRYLLTENDIARAAIRTLGQAPADVEGPAIELHRDYGRYLSTLIDDATADGFLDPAIDGRVLRLLIAGALNWSTAWFRPEGPASVAEIADLAARLATGRIAPAPS